MSIPSSTYRLQMHEDFPFQAAKEKIAYLRRLGIGAVYLSPILLARPGSRHGYDICDHNRINPELGGEEGFQDYAEALRRAGLGCLVDFVPNHMGANPGSNPWWRDILENGKASLYRDYFDIDWEPLKPDLRGKVLLPVLGTQYGKALVGGEIRLEYSAGAFRFRYGEHHFPMNPCHIPLLLENPGPPNLRETQPEYGEYLSILTAFRNLPGPGETDLHRIQERYREKEIARKRLEILADAYEPIRAFIDDRIRKVNGLPGEARSFDRLHDLLDRQAYRLANWRTAGQEINYRRFFDVNGLAALRMENPAVFQDTHGLMLRLAAEGLITGMRIDHVDGLYDPAGYLKRLREAVPSGGFYVVVEKILCGEETLPADWPVQGTTGYEFLADLNGLFVDPMGLAKLERIWRTVIGYAPSFIQVTRECKRLILETSMGSNLTVLADGLDRLSEVDWNYRDFTLKALRDAVREIIACLAIYRTYGTTAGFSRDDRRAIEDALEAAAVKNPAMEASIFRFLRLILLPLMGNGGEVAGGEAAGGEEETSLTVEQRVDFAMRLQQVTGAVQAKGVEDTAFYRYLVLLSLNEVGGDPDSRGMAAKDFHRRIRARTEAWPHGLLATATHDTKRGEDARARLNVLTAIPEDWKRCVGRLSKLTDTYRRKSGLPYPSDGDAYLLFQSLIGCWPMGPDGAPMPADPAFCERLDGFLAKAAKEAKLHTSWINPNEKHERALSGFLKELLLGSYRPRTATILFPILETCAREGACNSLNQIACKCAVPGVPDIYQGTEGWDLSLVDPDNRRAVDFDELDARLACLERDFPEGVNAEGMRRRAMDLLDNWQDGRIKMYTLWRCLQWRRSFPALFADGDYLPLDIEGGSSASAWLAFCRRSGGQALVVCIRLRPAQKPVVNEAPRIPLSQAMAAIPDPDPGRETLRLPRDWSERAFTHVFTGTRFPIPSSADGECRLPLTALAREFPTAWLWLE
ncbi:MAG: malto-oligosyltrehalose synthase [Fibrobacteria bacterium]